MLKKYLFIVAAVFAVIGFQSQAFAVPTNELVFTADMTKEQLVAVFNNADDVESALAKAIASGVNAETVVRAAVIAKPKDIPAIRAAIKAAVPPSEHALMDFAISDSAQDISDESFNKLAKGSINFDEFFDIRTDVIALIYTQTSRPAGGSTTAVKAASQATNG